MALPEFDLKVPPQKTTYSDEPPMSSSRNRDAFGGVNKGRIFNILWWKYFQDIADSLATLWANIAASGQSIVSQTLTANAVITADAPENDGDILFVFLTQNATGGWTITWDAAVFDTSTLTQTDTRASKTTKFEFVGVGGLWVQTNNSFWNNGSGTYFPGTLIVSGDETVTGKVLINRTTDDGSTARLQVSPATNQVALSIQGSTTNTMVVFFQNSASGSFPLSVINNSTVGYPVASFSGAARTSPVLNLDSGGGTAGIFVGSGTPEAAVTAAVGSIYLRTNGGAATTLYVKESGSGNTGWIAK